MNVLLKGFLLYLLAINLLAFLLYGIDKSRAKRGKWRIRESVLILMSFLLGTIGSLAGMRLFHHKTLKKKFRIGVPAILILQIFCALAAAYYFHDYYHADQTALAALKGSGTVQVKHISGNHIFDRGDYLFDGPGDDRAMIFYPGAKVDEKAYAPLLLKIAENGTDCVLVSMPLHFALLDTGAADQIRQELDYPHWVLAGHSLGGVAASVNLADHAGDGTYSAMIYFASYPAKDLHKLSIPALSVYGSRDMNLDAIHKHEKDYPAGTTVKVIEGGNHAQFGSYGIQKGYQTAQISAEDQQNQAAAAVSQFLESVR